MAVNNDDLKSIFKMFNDETFAQLKVFQADTQMEDEHLATVLGETIRGAMGSSVGALEVYKKLEVMDKDKEIKTQTAYTIIAKRKREQGATVAQDGTITYTADKSSQIENQIELLKKQALKVIADTTFVGKQGANMDLQVRHNCIIQAMDAAQGYNMGIGNAGLIPSQDMHTNFFVQNKALMCNAGVDFSATGEASFTPDGADASIVLGTFKVDVTAPAEATA